MSLQDQARKLPLSPGVYIWLDKNNMPLYVGRATSLRRRVLQYFRKDIDARIAEMVAQAKKIKFKKTDTVLESVILEANLIKKYHAKYNIKDRDDRSFVYLVFPKADFPEPVIVRERELNKFPPARAHVFGPYFSAATIKTILKLVRRIIPYSTCVPFSGKPCFDYQIGMCPGTCVGAISREDYRKNISNLILLFKGEKKKMMKNLSKENPAAAIAFRHIQDVTLINREEIPVYTGALNRIEAYDISHFSGKETYGSMAVFKGGAPDKSQYRLFKIKSVSNNDLEALREMVERRQRHAEWPRPDIILIDGGKPQVDYIYKFLQTTNMQAPMVGISKLHGDRLVFPPQAKKTFRSLAETIKTTLVQARDEAHRFAIKAHRKKRERIG